jgi:hypothetical protein
MVTPLSMIGLRPRHRPLLSACSGTGPDAPFAQAARKMSSRRSRRSGLPMVLISAHRTAFPTSESVPGRRLFSQQQARSRLGPCDPSNPLTF